MNKQLIAFVSILLLALVNCQVPAGLNKVLDYSTAGYRNSDYPIPDLSYLGITNVLLYGAIPDDGIDDSTAIQNAFDQTNSGVLFFPKGKYNISKPLNVTNKVNFTIRGDSNGGTILYSEKNAMDYGFSQFIAQNGLEGNIISIYGVNPFKQIGSVLQEAPQKGNQILVKNATDLQPGDTILITLMEEKEMNINSTLWSYLHGTESTIWNNSTMKVDYTLDEFYRVQNIEVTPNGHLITIKENLRTDIILKFRPIVFKHLTASKNVGIEFISFEFIETPQRYHNTEFGYNSLKFWNVIDFWARNLTFKNVDSGIRVHRASYGTILNTTFYGRGGHHSLLASHCGNIVFHNQDFRTKTGFWHAVGVSDQANNIVYSKTTTNYPRLNIDGHRKYSFANLFTDVRGRFSWESGGDASAGPHHARDTTFWGFEQQMPIATSNPAKFVGQFYQYLNNFISKNISADFKALGQTCNTTHIEEVPQLSIPNLFLYQLQNRCPTCIEQYNY